MNQENNQINPNNEASTYFDQGNVGKNTGKTIGGKNINNNKYCNNNVKNRRNSSDGESNKSDSSSLSSFDYTKKVQKVPEDDESDDSNDSDDSDSEQAAIYYKHLNEVTSNKMEKGRKIKKFE